MEEYECINRSDLIDLEYIRMADLLIVVYRDIDFFEFDEKKIHDVILDLNRQRDETNKKYYEQLCTIYRGFDPIFIQRKAYIFIVVNKIFRSRIEDYIGRRNYYFTNHGKRNFYFANHGNEQEEIMTELSDHYNKWDRAINYLVKECENKEAYEKDIPKKVKEFDIRRESRKTHKNMMCDVMNELLFSPDLLFYKDRVNEITKKNLIF